MGFTASDFDKNQSFWVFWIKRVLVIVEKILFFFVPLFNLSIALWRFHMLK